MIKEYNYLIYFKHKIFSRDCYIHFVYDKYENLYIEDILTSDDSVYNFRSRLFNFNSNGVFKVYLWLTGPIHTFFYELPNFYIDRKSKSIKFFLNEDNEYQPEIILDGVNSEAIELYKGLN